MSDQLPKMLKYKTVKPKGFPSEFKRWEVLPQTSSNNYNLMDVVRFQFKTDWYFDPFQTYMDIEVEFPQNDQNMGISTPLLNSGGDTNNGTSKKKKLNDIPVYSLDGPATSLIEEMVLYSNNREVERIQEYDVLGNLIADIGVPGSQRANKKFEGYHYMGNLHNFNQFKNNKQTHADSYSNGVAESGGLQKFSELSQVFSHAGQTDALGSLDHSQKKTALLAFIDNYQLGDYNGVTKYYDKELATHTDRGYFRNYAREFVLQDGSMGVDHANSRNSYPLLLDQLGTDLKDYDMTQSQTKFVKSNKRVLFNHESSVNQFDYMCPGIQAIKYQDGVYQDVGVRGACESNSSLDLANQQKLGVYKQVFHVPILSAVMGHLIPNDQWSLIPGKGCGEMVWEFRLNKYAFFTSGHLDNDRNLEADGIPNKQFTMDWKVTKISLRFDLWNFQQSVNQIINSQIASEQIIMTSQGFTMGPMQQIASSSQVRNNYQINNGILSLRNLYIFFLLNDYQRYNYCRKNFRVSHNIKSIQLKIGNQYIPKQPIMGNAGNIKSNKGLDDDVYPFLMELYRSQGEMFSTSNKCSITPCNFILNDRIYDPNSRIQTSNQEALLHEQRASGKAIYTVDMLADPYDSSVLSGFDTTQVRPIELLIDAHINEGALQRGSTMYIWLHHDTIVQFTDGGIITTQFG